MEMACGLWEGDGAGIIPENLEPGGSPDPLNPPGGLRGFLGIGHVQGIFMVRPQGSLC